MFMKTERVVISMRPSFLEGLDELADIEQVSRSEMIRRATKLFASVNHPDTQIFIDGSEGN
jgi:metal-responsive CopG/Arc/MetJ family transcriptional regulator